MNKYGMALKGLTVALAATLYQQGALAYKTTYTQASCSQWCKSGGYTGSANTACWKSASRNCKSAGKFVSYVHVYYGSCQWNPNSGGFCSYALPYCSWQCTYF